MERGGESSLLPNILFSMYPSTITPTSAYPQLTELRRSQAQAVRWTNEDKEYVFRCLPDRIPIPAHAVDHTRQTPGGRAVCVAQSGPTSPVFSVQEAPEATATATV